MIPEAAQSSSKVSNRPKFGRVLDPSLSPTLLHTVQTYTVQSVKLVRPILENLARELSELKKVNDIEHMIHEIDSQLSSNFGEKTTFGQKLFNNTSNEG